MDARSEVYPFGTTITPPAMSLRKRRGNCRTKSAVFTGLPWASNCHGASCNETSPDTSKNRFMFEDAGDLAHEQVFFPIANCGAPLAPTSDLLFHLIRRHCPTRVSL